MTNHDCIHFLQWSLPRLRMHWPGFRRVRGQVCKRISARVRELALADATAYRSHLEQHPDEWQVLDSLCRITISRFYRDAEVYRFLEQDVIPRLAQDALSRGESVLKCWSIGRGALVAGPAVEIFIAVPSAGAAIASPRFRRQSGDPPVGARGLLSGKQPAGIAGRMGRAGIR
jgi:hypothetical protein